MGGQKERTRLGTVPCPWLLGQGICSAIICYFRGAMASSVGGWGGLILGEGCVAMDKRGAHMSLSLPLFAVITEERSGGRPCAD